LISQSRGLGDVYKRQPRRDLHATLGLCEIQRIAYMRLGI
jgi:hypothetical protein